MFQDTRVLSQHGAFASLWERQVIVFHDQSSVQLYAVRRNGIDDTHLRALLYGNAHWCVFDLRSISRTIAGDFAALLMRDHAGVVLYTLREQFAGDAQFIAAAFKNFVSVWTEGSAEPLLIEGAPPMARITFQPELRTAA